MKCPNCGKLMSKDREHIFCTHCGYLDDGKQIHGYQESLSSDLEIYLGKDFDKIWRNTTWLSNLILGPLYLCYRGFVLLGLLLMPLEWVFWNVVANSFSKFYYPLLFLAIVTSRMFFMTVNNMICIYFYQKRINKIKKKYPDTYLEQLRKNNHHVNNYMSLFLAFLIILLTFISLIFIAISLWSE